MNLESVSISSLIEDPSNARKHSPKNIEAIKGSLAKFGQQKPIVINKTNVVLAGNGTLQAAKALGWDKINVVKTELEGTEAIAYAIADNRTGELAAWNDDVLSKTLKGLKDDGIDLGSIGFDDEDLQQWLKAPEEEKLPADESSLDDASDEIPEIKEPRVKAGETWQSGNLQITCGDCLEVLKTFESDSADSLVTDPPAGISFMGKEWDDNKGGSKQWIAWMTEVMTEAMRVLKPGAHGLVWAIPRTSHWTATALESAGFEIRDVVTHLFGTGFPKSLDISKAIDKAAGVEREVLRVDKSAVRKNAIKNNTNDTHNAGFKPEGSGVITAPSTSLAKQWSGWGTALKPASEHWILVRKPCSEDTVAKNVEKWGVGGINVDGCRVEGKPRTTHADGNFQSKTDKSGKIFEGYGLGFKCPEPTGRFPANLILDEVAAEMLDEQSGFSKTPKTVVQGASNKTGLYGNGKGLHSGLGEKDCYGDSGGASRFFYVAKASKSERNAGLEDLDAKEVKRHGNRDPDVGRQPQVALSEKNNHPTVKSQSLMRYLCRLVTPKGGKILDCFNGSGSTGLAAQSEGCSYRGIEKQPEYCDISITRWEAFTGKPAVLVTGE